MENLNLYSYGNSRFIDNWDPDLESKYEYKSFIQNLTGEELGIIDRKGIGKETLGQHMQLLLDGLQKYEYFIEPEFDNNRLSKSGGCFAIRTTVPVPVLLQRSLIHSNSARFSQRIIHSALFKDLNEKRPDPFI